jgi:hypothetical protein
MFEHVVNFPFDSRAVPSTFDPFRGAVNSPNVLGTCGRRLPTFSETRKPPQGGEG